MLSADVPEFIPKALRNDGQAATRTNAEEDGSSSLAADALQTKPDLADESPSSTSKECSTDVASCDVNFEEEHHLSDNDGLAKESLPSKMGMVVSSIHNEESNILNSESNLPVLEVDQDADITAEFENRPASPAAATSVPVTQGDGESPVIASSLRATSAEFFPAGMYLGYNSPANSPGPQMSYTGSPSPHNSPGFMYPNGPPFYYEPNSFSYCCDSNWAHDLDYNQGFYNPILNAGHYSAGEYFVPNGGYMFEGGDGGYPQQPPPGAGHMVEHTYFDPNLAAEYSRGFVDVPGSGAIGRGGGTAGGGAPGGAPGGYNKKYPSKNRQKRPPDHGGGRGAAGAGGSRQPSNEMRICGQTGELTLGKRRPQGNTSQGGRGSAHQQVKVQASTIISNVKNWPTLNMGKVEKEKCIVSPSANDGAPVVAANEHDRAAVCKIVEPTVAKCVQPPPAISFSSIAKKQSDVTEPAFFSLKQSNPGPSAVKAKKKDLLPNKTSGDNKKMKGAQYTPASGVETGSSKKSGSNESTNTKSEMEWTYKGKQPNSVKATPIVIENLQQEVMRQPNSSVSLTPMTKSAKKKAKKNRKLLAAAAVSGLIEESSIESNEITMRASSIGNDKSEDVVLLAIVDEEPSVSVIPEKSKIVSEWLNKDVSSTAPKYSKKIEESQPNAKTHKEKKSASDDVENKAVTSTVSSSVNSTEKGTNVLGQRTVESSSTEEAKKAATTIEEFTWFTVGKRSKSKKAPLPKELDQISPSQNRKSYKGNSKRDKQNAPQGSTVLARTNIAIQEIAPKVGSSSSPTTKDVVNAQKEDSSSSYGSKPKVVSAPKDGSSNSSNTKPKVVSKTETSAQISSPEGDPKKELDKVELLLETTVSSTTVEPKKRDLNDLEVQKIMKHREIRKENIKREKKLNREAAALEKKAIAKKDTKISVMPALSPKSAVMQVTAAESFAIKSEEYPSLGAKKAPKSQIDKSDKNLKKDAVRKINGIIQLNPEQVVSNVKTKSQDESNAVALSNVWTTGSKNAPAITTSSQDSIKSISTISLPSPAPAEESVGVRRKVLSYSLAAASVPAVISRDLKTRSGSTAPAEATKKGTVTVRAKKNVQLHTRSKQVKYSDKLEIDLRNLLVIKPSRLKRGQASSIVSQAVASRTARRTTGARPVRVLTTTVGKQPRIKGQKRKGPTAIQRYKRFHALHRQDLLLLLADLKRRQDAEQKTDINTEGFREENSNKSQTSSSDLSNSTNNTSIPVSICSSLLSNNAATCFNSSASGLADTSYSADDAAKSSNKKCKRNKKSSNTEDSSSTAAVDSSTKSLQVVAVTQDMPEAVVASAVVAVEQKEAVAHKPLSPAEAKEIADRLADELEKMQGTKNKIVKTNFITQELNDHIAALLIDIVRFQRRSYFHDQIKAKAKRRFVSGIKEVQKKLHKIQLLVVAQDVGKAIPMVADSAAALLKEAEAQHVPVVFALNRGRIGRLTRKESGFKISCVGILNFQGAEDSVKGIMSILPELKRRQQLINDSKKGDTITNSILEEEEDSSSLACDGDSGPSSATVTSSSSSNQSTPAKVSAASVHESKSGPQVMRGKNGIRQMTAVTGKLSGGAAAGLGTTPFTTVAASLEVNDKIVSILKEQENHVSNENQTS